jgi:hypothetical protein
VAMTSANHRAFASSGQDPWLSSVPTAPNSKMVRDIVAAGGNAPRSTPYKAWRDTEPITFPDPVLYGDWAPADPWDSTGATRDPSEGVSQKQRVDAFDRWVDKPLNMLESQRRTLNALVRDEMRTQLAAQDARRRCDDREQHDFAMRGALTMEMKDACPPNAFSYTSTYQESSPMDTAESVVDAMQGIVHASSGGQSLVLYAPGEIERMKHNQVEKHRRVPPPKVRGLLTTEPLMERLHADAVASSSDPRKPNGTEQQDYIAMLEDDVLLRAYDEKNNEYVYAFPPLVHQ